MTKAEREAFEDELPGIGLNPDIGSREFNRLFVFAGAGSDVALGRLATTRAMPPMARGSPIRGRSLREAAPSRRQASVGRGGWKLLGSRLIRPGSLPPASDAR